MEDKLRSIWAKVLDTDESNIDSEANFFELGGDSVGAVNAVGLATAESIPIDAQAIFTNPTLSGLASVASSRQEQASSQKAEESVASCTESLNQLLPHWDLVNSCLLQCGFSRSQVQDIIPCPPFQSELMNASHNLNCWQFQAVWELQGDTQHAKRAFEVIYKKNDVFRTRIVKYGSSLYQVVSSEPIVWRELEGSLEDYKAQQLEKRMVFGDALSRFTIIKDGAQTYLVWNKVGHIDGSSGSATPDANSIQTHAVYDRFSKMRLFEDIAQCFKDPATFESNFKRPQFADFSRFVCSQDQQKAIGHWKQHLEGLQRSDTLFSDEEASKREFQTSPQADARVKMTYTKPPQTKINFSTIIHVAWALVLANESGLDDIFFPTVRSCRAIAMPGIESIIGPLWSMVPCRLQLKGRQSLLDLLEQVERAAVEGMPHEPFGITAMNEFFGHKRYLETALLPQPPKPSSFSEKVTAKDADTGAEVSLQPTEELFSQTRGHFGLYIMITPIGQDLDLWARFDKSFINEERSKRLLTEFSSMIDRISKGSDDWKTTSISALCHKLPKPHGEAVNGVNGVKDTGASDAINQVETVEGNTLQQLLPKGINNTAVVVPGDKGHEVSYEDLSQHVEQLQKDLAGKLPETCL